MTTLRGAIGVCYSFSNKLKRFFPPMLPCLDATSPLRVVLKKLIFLKSGVVSKLCPDYLHGIVVTLSLVVFVRKKFAQTRIGSLGKRLHSFFSPLQRFFRLTIFLIDLSDLKVRISERKIFCFDLN